MLLGTTSPNIRKGSHLWRRFAKGSHFRARLRQTLERDCTVTGRDGLQAHEKGSDIRAEAPKGSRFWARLRQTPERVHTFNKILLRVRTFGHAFAGTSKGCALLGLTCKGFAPLVKVRKGFALLGTALPNIQKGSHFCADPGQNLERARTFGEGLQRDRAFGHGRANYSEGVALLDICSKGFALFLIFCLWRKGIAVFEH